MKRFLFVLLLSRFLFPISIHGNAPPEDTVTFSLLLTDAISDYLLRQRSFQSMTGYVKDISGLQDLMANLGSAPPSEFQAGILAYLQAKERSSQLEAELELDLLGLRYRKGIDFIKLLYEKILSLEHHFATLQTLQQIQAVSNPHNFDGFEPANDYIRSQLGKKHEVTLPEVFQGNPYVSVVSTLVGSFIGQGSREEKEEHLREIACILDFTVRMHADLKLIYFETEFLKSTALALKRDCEETFAEYVSFLDYPLALDDCRSQDKWLDLEKKVKEQLDISSPDTTKMPGGVNRAIRINLEFSIHRLYSFMQRYGAFVDQGTHYYHKFVQILHTYQNEEACKEDLPDMLKTLQEDMENAREKFTTAYYMKELHGSKLKELLFGLVY